MAEAFGRELGDGLLEAASAGLYPAAVIQPETFQAMAERGVRLEDRPPRSLQSVNGAAIDLIVNMVPLPVAALLKGFAGREIAWRIRDPIGQPIEVYREVRDEIERRVRELIEALRRGEETPPSF
jgi:arsenate reductase